MDDYVPDTSTGNNPTPWSPGIPSTGEGTNYLVLMGILFVVIGSAQMAFFILRRKWESEEQEEE